MNFTLTLNITPKDLNVIFDARQKVALAKPVSNSSANVIWTAFAPFEHNSIQWSEEYWIYVSTSSANKNGEQIKKMSQTHPGPAITGSIYTFDQKSGFSQPVRDPNVGADTFAAQNDMPYDQYPSLTFGLAQSVLVNQKIEEQNPISAASVLATQQIQETPCSNVYIWLESDFGSGTIITADTDAKRLKNVNGKKSVAKFGGGVNKIEMTYDGKSGLFLQ
ncbi:hypothetical protein LF95_13885 [Thalassospira sp. TSL5-1]|nr:hypothetical protein LF95_13885 [Thalassospira sp. TSL5-1]